MYNYCIIFISILFLLYVYNKKRKKQENNTFSFFLFFLFKSFLFFQERKYKIKPYEEIICSLCKCFEMFYEY